MFGSKQSLGRRHLNSVTSQDSGFTSQDTLYNNVNTSTEYSSQVSRIKFNIFIEKSIFTLYKAYSSNAMFLPMFLPDSIPTYGEF